MGSSDPIQDIRIITISRALTLEFSRRKSFVRAIGALIGFNSHDQPQLGSPPHPLLMGPGASFQLSTGLLVPDQLQLHYSHVCVWLGSLVIQVLLQTLLLPVDLLLESVYALTGHFCLFYFSYFHEVKYTAIFMPVLILGLLCLLDGDCQSRQYFHLRTKPCHSSSTKR